MGGLINLIKKLFSGILSFIGGIAGGKGGGYYLELDESEAGKPAPQAVAPAKVEAPAPAATAPAKSSAKPAAVKAEPIASNGAKPPASSNGAVPQVPAATSLAAASTLLNTPRRRPGANMNSYLEMAKQVKTPG
jgi:hypothetical protein